MGDRMGRNPASPPRPGRWPERPCFISDAQEKEFEMLVDYARRSITACGEDHARGALVSLVPLSHDTDAIMRIAQAEGR